MYFHGTPNEPMAQVGWGCVFQRPRRKHLPAQAPGYLLTHRIVHAEESTPNDPC